MMTSKTVEDVDETTLSYAEIKAIATGNPLIKEKIDIDVKLERLKFAKSEFLMVHELLEHKAHYTYPRKIQDAEKIFTFTCSNIYKVNLKFYNSAKKTEAKKLANDTMKSPKIPIVFINDDEQEIFEETDYSTPKNANFSGKTLVV